VPQELWSGTKSVVTLLAARAAEDGLLTLDEPASKTLTEWKADPARRAITLHQLLTMTAGIASQVGMPPGYIESLTSVPSDPPGTAFRYGPTPYQIFGEVLQRKLAAREKPMSIAEYADMRLFRPLGIATPRWRVGRDNQLLMPQGLALSTTDWAKVGLLINGYGRFAGTQVIRPESLAPLFLGTTANPAYGVGWWLPKATSSADPITATFDLPRHASEIPGDLVAAAGAGGQRLYAVPSRQLVIVRQARLDLASLRQGKPADNVQRWSDAEFLAILLGNEE
jgi:CubicO group peptidase (beta-lactamase class C family)